MTESEPSLAEQILAGDNPTLLRLAAQGLLPVATDELIPLQVQLASTAEGGLALEAAAALRGLERRFAVDYLERSAGPDELAFFAREVQEPKVLEAILRRRDVPRSLLVEMAGRLGEELQEILLLRQDAVVEEPAILDALAANPELSGFARRRIGEYREHLLPRERNAEVGAEESEEATDEEAREAIVAVQEQPQPTADIDLEEAGGLTEPQIRLLPAAVRLRLARGASRNLRSIMIRDPNPQVALSVLRGNALSDQEIEQVAQNRVVVEEVLDEIMRRRSWIRKYRILRAVVANPRTPVGAAVKLVPRLSVRDLRTLSRDRNTSQPVRDAATRLYRIKRM